MAIIGLDLAGKEKNPTGFALLNSKVILKELYSDKEILDETVKHKAKVIAVDAPFSFPKEGYFREADLLLKKRGFRVLSPMFPSMQLLVNRAKELIKKVKKKSKAEIIEVFPRAAEKILMIERKKVEEEHRELSDHEFDAMLCALTGKLYLEKNVEAVGKKDKIIIPKL